MAVQVAVIADSAGTLTATAYVRHTGESFESELPKYSRSSAEIALIAAMFGPRFLPARRTAAELSLKASSLGEAMFDSTWADRALEQVTCAIQLSDSAVDPGRFAKLRKLERDIRQAVAWSVGR